MKLTIVDGNNWFRRRLESTGFGSPVRNCFYELQNREGMVICIWDGWGALSKRREIFPEYKMKRTPPGEDIYKSQDLLKKLLEFSKVVQIQIPGYEGDDVIAAIAELYKPHFDFVFIESNDLDMYQLGLPMSRDRYPEQAKWIRLYKTFVGDSSDNIPGLQGFGKTMWGKLTEQDKEVLEHILTCGWGYSEQDIEAKAAFMAKGPLNLFKKKETREQLAKFHRIVGFLDVPKNIIDEHMKPGNNRPDLAEPIFQEYLL